jgi:hypothetical protein
MDRVLAQLGRQGIMVKNGFMSVELGQVTAFGSSVDWNQDTLWLSMNVGNTNTTCAPFTSCAPDGEMVPMKRLTATPYALNAGQLGGLTSNQFLQIAQGVQTDVSTNTSSVFVNKTGSGGNFFQLQSAGTDVFAINSTGDVVFGSGANHSISIATAAASTAGRQLSLVAGGGGGGTGSTGGTLVLQGGAAGGTNGNGGNVAINAGAATGTGTAGVISIGTSNTSAITLGQNTTVQASSLTVGTNAVAGSVIISDGTNNTASIAVGDLAGNYTYTIPVTTANDLLCLQTLGNCTGTGVTAIGAYSTTNTAVDGATISGNSIIFQNASASAPGMVGTGTQTFAGDKTFTGSLTINNVTFDPAANRSISMGTSPADVAGRSLTMSGGAAGTGAAALAGGNLVIQGGTGGGTNGNGGDVSITGGAANGTGTKGLVHIGPSTHTTVTNASCAVDCTIAQSNVDNYGTIIVSATTSDIVITLPAPTNTAAGRTVYITTSPTSLDFTLQTNSGANLIDVAMRKNTTSSMIWNGTAWTPGGASNATTLQATYNNGSNPATTPEIKLDSIRGTIDIQDADTTIGTDLLNVRGSNPTGLGTVLFGVSNTGRVTIQGTTDQSSAFRVLNSVGDYLFNVNSTNNYVLNNSIKAPGNEIANPGFEAGGSITGGEEGWFGPAAASIANEPTNARSGNHVLKITANSSNLDVFAGSYYEITAGENLYIEGWVKNSLGATGNAGVQITWYNKDKGFISNSTAYPDNPGTSYVQRTMSATAPAGAQYAKVSATIRSNATTGTFYFDDLYMKRNLESASMTYRNAANSTSAFRIQSAGSANTLFTANTSSNIVRIGDGAGSGSDTTLLVLDSASSDPTSLTGLDGGIFYRTDSNSLKAVIGGAVVDICTTAVTCTGYSASAGSAIQLQSSTPGTAQTGNFNITGTGILTQLQTQDRSTATTHSQNLTIRTGNATGSSSNSGNLVLDVGTATGTTGSITIGHSGVQTTMPGRLAIQGSNALTLGSANTASGSILLYSAVGTNSITIRAPSNPPASYVLTLPVNMAADGECLKTDSAGTMYFQGCGVGVNFNLQDAYNNSGAPAEVALADGKDFLLTASEVAGTDPSIVFNLMCGSSCNANTNGRFKVQNAGADVLSVLPNGGGIILNAKTQIGSATTNSTQTLFQLDSYNGSTDDPAQGCSSTVNQGAMYYNTSMGSIRSCINGSWSDVSNPDTLGLLTFGIVPSSGGQPYDLPALVNPGYSGPCKASWASQFEIYIQACTAYSNGRRLSVPARTLQTNSTTAPHTSLTTANRWGHICLNPTSGEPEFTARNGVADPKSAMPTFSASQPILCIADVQGSGTTAGVIDNLYDVRTFTSAMKEAVNVATAVELGMLVDSSPTGIVPSAACSSGTCSGKLYGGVVATDGSTSAGAPNAIVVSVGPAFVKGTAGNAGEFVRSGPTAGYGVTVSAIPNNAFYFSPGNSRTAYSTTCTAANNCGGSMYVNFIVR